MTTDRYDKGLSELLDCTGLVRIAGGHGFAEGPVWHADGFLLYSDIPQDRICFWSYEGVKTYRQPSGHTNGLALDGDLRLIACEQGTRRVSRTEQDGACIGIADRFEGKRLNSPNDVVVRSDGSIYFTDPADGCPEGQRDLNLQGIFCISPEGELRVAIQDMERPNGLVFSPNETVLYVDDSAGAIVWAYDVRSDGTLIRGRSFAELQSDEDGVADGMTVDTDGRLYVAGPEGLWVFDSDGNRLGILVTPETPSNCCWGGANRQTMFITARSSVYRIQLRIRGV